MLRRSLIVWLVMLVAASINGAFREAVLIPAIGKVSGGVISPLILMLVVVLLTWFTIRWIHPASTRDAWLIGGLWVVLTLAFEFLAGHYVFGTPWRKLLADYNVLAGRVWILVLVTTVFAPLLTARTGNLLLTD